MDEGLLRTFNLRADWVVIIHPFTNGNLITDTFTENSANRTNINNFIRYINFCVCQFGGSINRYSLFNTAPHELENVFAVDIA